MSDWLDWLAKQTISLMVLGWSLAHGGVGDTEEVECPAMDLTLAMHGDIWQGQ